MGMPILGKSFLAVKINVRPGIALLPKMVEIIQKVPSERIDDPRGAVLTELDRIGLQSRVKPESQIAVAVGSRGIAEISACVSAVVQALKECGASPFIIPAMGSHGGGTPEGQKAVLKDIGVTEELVGAPIKSSLAVQQIGTLNDSYPVYASRDAVASDGIILVNRVKPHTDFKDRIESGIMKLAVIGVGKQKGAEIFHSNGMEAYHSYLPKVARYVIDRLPIVLGLAIVENARHEIAMVEAILPGEIEEKEAQLLEKAKQLMPRIPFQEVDLLIVQEIGKNISGAGMDPNVTGRFLSTPERPRGTLNPKVVVVLDLTDETEGNAAGIGLADLTTRRLFDKIDFESTFLNALTSGFPRSCSIPVFLPSDSAAIETGLRIIHPPVIIEKARVVMIRNTLDLGRIWVSENLLQELRSRPDMAQQITVMGEPQQIMVDVLGNLTR
jgi:hypothetical protein